MVTAESVWTSEGAGAHSEVPLFVLQVVRRGICFLLLLLAGADAERNLRGGKDHPDLAFPSKAAPTGTLSDSETIITGTYCRLVVLDSPLVSPCPFLTETRFFSVLTSGPLVDDSPAATYSILRGFAKSYRFLCKTAEVGKESSQLWPLPNDGQSLPLCTEVRANARPSRRTFHFSRWAPQVTHALPKISDDVRRQLAANAASEAKSAPKAQLHPLWKVPPVSTRLLRGFAACAARLVRPRRWPLEHAHPQAAAQCTAAPRSPSTPRVPMAQEYPMGTRGT